MTESTDPLVKWDWEIAAAEAAYLADGGDESAMHCIHDLAAEVRALRAEVASWQEMFECLEESDRDCRAGVPLLTHEEVFGVAPIPNATEALP
jgi:hypothetical protein